LQESQSNRLRVSDVLISRLIEYGIDHVFLVVGGNAMYLHDAVRISGLNYTAFQNEQSAAMAAEAYSRITGKISLCISTSGPGASNLATGIAGAYFDSVPIFFITGQPRSTQLVSSNRNNIGVRQVGTFEFPATKVFQSILKSAKVLSIRDEPSQIVDELVTIATSGRPGPVLLEVSVDIQANRIIPTNNAPLIENKSLEIFNAVIFDSIQKDLNFATKPLILIGHGVRVSGLAETYLEEVKRLKIPVVSTQLAKDFMGYENELFVGHIGIRGNRAANHAVQQCDLLITIGSSLHQQNIGYEIDYFAPNAKKIILDFETSVSGKYKLKNSTFIDQNLNNFLIGFKKLSVDNFKIRNWKETLLILKENLSPLKEPYKVDQEYINIYEFARALSLAATKESVVITDAGLCFYIMGQSFQLTQGQRYLVSGGLGAMGYTLPSAIGAGITEINNIIGVTGDGSAQFNVQDLATLTNSQKNISLFIINNEGYASIRNTQKSFFGAEFIGCSEESGVLMPDWKLIAEAYKLNYYKFKKPLNLITEIKRILDLPGPKIIEIIAQIEQEVLPGVANYIDENGDLRSRPLDNMIPELFSEKLPENYHFN
jgi:acetolactate synthase-1/2/3 large subunit